MAWCQPGDKSLSEPMIVILLMHIYASLSPNESIKMVATPERIVLKTFVYDGNPHILTEFKISII